MEKFLMGITALLLFKVCDGLRAFAPRTEDSDFPLARKGFTVTNTTQLRFKLKACNDAHIVLQEDDAKDIVRTGNWDFAIGSYTNSKSYIRSPLVNGHIYCIHPEVLLNCNQFRPFWIRWKGGLLELGKGSEFGTDRICIHTITPVNFNYVFILTRWRSEGCWNIDSSSTVLTSGWAKVPGNRKLQGLKVKSYKTRTQLECGNICSSSTEALPCGCVEYSFNMVTKQCLVVDESEPSTIVSATDWKTWQLM